MRIHVLLCVLAVGWIPWLANARISVEGRNFTDETGHTYIFRGMNIAGNVKTPNFRQLEALEESYFETLEAWGHNVARLLFIWEAFEGEGPGQYDESYLAYYKTLLDRLHARGIKAIIDFHQDGFSRFAIKGCGQGFPKWALPKDYPYYEPDNGSHCQHWYMNLYKDRKVKEAYNNLYRDSEVRRHYLNMLQRVGEAFKEHPGVLGVEFINEPWGDIDLLGQFYQASTAALREVFPEAVVFLDAHGLSPTIIGAARPFRRSLLRIPDSNIDNWSYAPHFYHIAIDHPFRILPKGYPGFGVKSALDVWRDIGAEYDVPIFLGEFGIPNSSRNKFKYIREIYRYLNKHHMSGAQWDFTPGWTEDKKDGFNHVDFSVVDDKGGMRDNYIPRAFVRKFYGSDLKVQGHIYLDKQNQVQAESSLRVSWTSKTGPGETEIYLPKGGENLSEVYEIEVTEADFVAGKGRIECEFDQQGKPLLHCSTWGDPVRYRLKVSKKHSHAQFASDEESESLLEP